MFFDPIPTGRFGFDVGKSVHGADRKCRFASCNGVFFGIQRVPVGNLDPQSLSQAMTGLGLDIARHDQLLVRIRK